MLLEPTAMQQLLLQQQQFLLPVVQQQQQWLPSHNVENTASCEKLRYQMVPSLFWLLKGLIGMLANPFL